MGSPTDSPTRLRPGPPNQILREHNTARFKQRRCYVQCVGPTLTATLRPCSHLVSVGIIGGPALLGRAVSSRFLRACSIFDHEKLMLSGLPIDSRCARSFFFGPGGPCHTDASQNHEDYPQSMSRVLLAPFDLVLARGCNARSPDRLASKGPRLVNELFKEAMTKHDLQQIRRLLTT